MSIRSARPQPPRKPRTREDALRDFRTDQILEAARRVIGELGYAEASIDRIADAAKVARSTIYVYFDGKEDLLNCALAQDRVALNDRVRQAVARAQGFEDSLRIFLTTVFEYVGEYLDFFQAIMRVRGVDPFFEERERPVPELDVIRADAQSVLADIFKQAEAAGELDSEVVADAGTLLSMIVYGALMRRAHDPAPPSPRAQAQTIVRIFLYGVMQPPAGSPTTPRG